MLFSHSSNLPIGLDISDLSLRLVQFYRSRNKIKFQAISRARLAPGIIENGEIRNSDALSKIVHEMIAKPAYGAVTTSEVVACLPEPKTFIKFIKVNKSPNRINDIISGEIEKYIPISIKDIYFDWQIINEDNETYGILIAAAQKNIVDHYIQVLNNLDLSVNALEVEASSICRALLAEEKPKFTIKSPRSYGIVDIGLKRTSMIIYSNNTIVLSISIPISGEEVTNEISKTLEINHEQAEKSKIICGLDQSKAQGIIYKILTDVLIKLNSRIENTLDFYSEHYSYLKEIDQILLCGGGAKIKNITETMESSIKIKTIEANPFTNINETEESFLKLVPTAKEDKNKDKPQQINFTEQDSSLSFTTAIGLALRNIFIENK